MEFKELEDIVEKNLNYIQLDKKLADEIKLRFKLLGLRSDN